MATEVIDIAVNQKTVAAALTPEALTDRDVRGTSVFIRPIAGQSGAAYVCDSNDTSKIIPIPSGGLTLPIMDPRLITIDVETSGQGVDWMCI